jgi:hypothetical protein
MTEFSVLSLALDLLEGDAERRLAALDMLDVAGDECSAAVPSAIHVLGDASVSIAVRLRAMTWLASVSTGSELVVRACIRVLRSETDRDLRRQAVETMRRHPSAFAEAVPALMEVLAEPWPDAELVDTCLAALTTSPLSLVPYLDALVEHAELGTSEQKALALDAVVALARCDQTHTPLAIRLIQRALQSTTSTMFEREAALRGVISLGPAASSVAADVVTLLASEDRLIVEATQALVALGDSAISVTDRLISRTARPQPPLGSALVALHAIAPDSLPLVWGNSADVEETLGRYAIGHWVPEPLRPALVAAIDALLERSRDINWDRRWHWGLKELIALGAVDTLGRWLGEPPREFSNGVPTSPWMAATLTPVIESAPSLRAASLLALARWDPSLRVAVARRVSVFPDTSDALLPALLAWLGTPGTMPVVESSFGRPVIVTDMTPLHEAAASALARASRTRPWLHSLILQRIASFGPEAPAGLGDRLAEALASAS